MAAPSQNATQDADGLFWNTPKAFRDTYNGIEAGEIEEKLDLLAAAVWQVMDSTEGTSRRVNKFRKVK